jgi:hypothetical protein
MATIVYRCGTTLHTSVVGTVEGASESVRHMIHTFTSLVSDASSVKLVITEVEQRRDHNSTEPTE